MLGIERLGMNVFTRTVPAAREAVQQFSTEALVNAKRAGDTVKVNELFLTLAKEVEQKTVSPEELLRMARNCGGNTGYYSRTFINPEGALEKILSNGDRVVISKDGGNTLRKVYNKNGKMILDDAKIVSQEQVGNKTVRTKQWVRTNAEWPEKYGIGEHVDYKFNYKADRVYDKNGNFLGMRETEVAPERFWIGSLEQTRNQNATYVTKTVPDKTVSVKDQYGFEHGPRIAKSQPSSNDCLDRFHGVKEFVGEGTKKRVTSKSEVSRFDANGKYDSIGAGAYKPFHNTSLRQPVGNSLGYSVRSGDALQGYSMYGFYPQDVLYNSKGLPIPRDYTMGFPRLHRDPKEFENLSMSEIRNIYKQDLINKGLGDLVKW